MSQEEKKENIEQLPACSFKGELVPEEDQLPDTAIMSDLTYRELIRNAIGMLKRSYSPYSGFQVGASLLASSKKIYNGCNIENSTFSPTNCAERTAFFKAVSEGETEFRAIAIVGGKDGVLDEYCPPCGVCRQVIMEFCDPDNFLVILAKSEDDYWIYPFSDLLPMAFSPKFLGKWND